MRLILASSSPRRRELLALLQVPFESVTPSFRECPEARRPPSERAAAYATGKARSCAAGAPEALVLGCDTLIAFDDRVLGKPNDPAEAQAMLWALRGREHRVHTAVVVLRHADDRFASGVETVRVWMRAFSRAELDRYVAGGECMGKAGAYAIQGAGGRLVERIEGDFTATVGLPLELTAALLQQCGLTIPVDVHALYRAKPYPNWAVFA